MTKADRPIKRETYSLSRSRVPMRRPTMRITITQDCIDRANVARRGPISAICPIAQAFRDLLYEYVSVDFGAVSARRVSVNAEYEEYRLPPEAQVYASDFDTGFTVFPVCFEVFEAGAKWLSN